MSQEWNDLPHVEKYRALVEALGIKLAENAFGRSDAEWQRLYSQDEHLNNVPLREWDRIANSYRQQKGAKNPLREGWNLSQSDLVCAYKQAMKDQIIKPEDKIALDITIYVRLSEKEAREYLGYTQKDEDPVNIENLESQLCKDLYDWIRKNVKNNS